MRHLVPYVFARSHRLLPAGERDGSLVLWVTERTPPAAIAEVRRTLGRNISLELVGDSRFDEGFRAAYVDGSDQAASVVGEVESEVDLDRLLQDMPAVEDLLDARDDAPIVRMLNAMLSQAVREGASDIHVEPFEANSVVRYRVDGTLRDVVRPRRGLHAALVSRIKIMASLDIAEKRLPQDGRIMLRLGGRPIDVRVSTLPAGHGERVVLRLLDKGTRTADAGEAGDGIRYARRDRGAGPAEPRHCAGDGADGQRQDHNALRHALACGLGDDQRADG